MSENPDRLLTVSEHAMLHSAEDRVSVPTGFNTYAQAPDAPEPKPERWGRIEIVGHRRHFGRFREITFLGVRMLEVDQPVRPGVFATSRYNAQAIFGVHDLTKEDVIRHLRLYGEYPSGEPDGVGDDVEQAEKAFPAFKVVAPVIVHPQPPAEY